MKTISDEGSIDATTVSGESSIDRTTISGESTMDSRFANGESTTEFEGNGTIQQGFDYTLDFAL